MTDTKWYEPPAQTHHYVTLTGYSKDLATNKVYFEAKNSFEKRWGIYGYLRVYWDACDVLRYASATLGHLPTP